MSGIYGKHRQASEPKKVRSIMALGIAVGLILTPAVTTLENIPAYASTNSLTIGTGTTSGVSLSGSTYTANNSASVLNATELEGVLQAETPTGPIVVEASGDITISASIVSNSAKGLILKAGGDIIVNSEVTISTEGGDVVLWVHPGVAGSSTTTSGAIAILANSTITTGAGTGDIVLGGGADSNGRPSGFAYGAYRISAQPTTGGTPDGSAAILLNSATLTAGQGGITMRGHGTGALNDWQIGVWLQESVVSGGSVDIDGRGSLLNGRNSHFGTLVAGTVIESAGEIVIKGQGGKSEAASGGNNQIGVLIAKYPPGAGTTTQSRVKATGSGTISIVGVGGANGVTNSSHGVWIEAATVVESHAGDITIDGQTGEASSTSIPLGVAMFITPTSQTGNIKFTGRLADGNTYGGGVALAGAEATAGRVTVTSPGAVTQTQPILATELMLRGPGTFTLTNDGNTVGTIAGGPAGEHLGTVSYVDSSGGLTIGDVGGVSGVTATGAISILTRSGDINLTRPVQSNLASGDAVRLSANSLATVDDVGDGDIKVSGTGQISIESGARALLFSGAAATSTGLSNLAGSVSNIRTRVADTLDPSGIEPALAPTGLFVLYRVEGTGLEASAVGQGSSRKSPSDGKQLDEVNADQLAATGVSPATGLLLSSLALLLIGLGSLAVRKRARVSS